MGEPNTQPWPRKASPGANWASQPMERETQAETGMDLKQAVTLQAALPPLATLPSQNRSQQQLGVHCVGRGAMAEAAFPRWALSQKRKATF